MTEKQRSALQLWVTAMQYLQSVFPEFIFTLIFQDPTWFFSSATCCPFCFVLFVCFCFWLFICLFGFCLAPYFCSSLCFEVSFPPLMLFWSSLGYLVPVTQGKWKGFPGQKSKACSVLGCSHQEGTCKEPQTTERLPRNTHWNNWLPTDSSALKELTTLKMYTKILP